MRIGIDASRAFLKRRTGIEEYSYQVIKHLRDSISSEHSVVLYVRKKFEIRDGQLGLCTPIIDFELPKHWKVKGLWAPRFWTQLRLSLEMFFHSPDVLFVPAHTIPVIHPQKTVVTVHGLEYEFSPESYSLWERLYMRLSIWFSVFAAEKVISVSENTKRDLIRLYHVPKEKIQVVYEGISEQLQSGIFQSETKKEDPYFLFVGRLETRKNVVRIIKAFELFKEKTRLLHRLILVGKPGYGYKFVQQAAAVSVYKDNILFPGYISDEEKEKLLRGATGFLFPSLYEGFGLPVLEAQEMGVPVITSNTSSLPEIGGAGALYVDPLDEQALAWAMEKIVQDPQLKADIMTKGKQNTSRFNWQQTADTLAEVLMNQDGKQRK